MTQPLSQLSPRITQATGGRLEMNPIGYQVASGHAFFTGIALVIFAAWASTQGHGWLRRATAIVFLIGVTAITISSTAISYWWYGVAAVATLLWIASRYRTTWQLWAPWTMIATWAVAALLEMPYHTVPKLQPAASRSLTVIGDSVTAGMGAEDEITWPTILARNHDIAVQDISHVGETASSALQRAQREPIAGAVVLLEIGGNDLLGSTTSAEFAADLDALLTYVSSRGRQVLLFELPLPPLCHEYGRIQRALSLKHGVVLVPKGVLLSVLAREGATLDTIHLSPRGHERMANVVYELVRPGFP